jgi:homoserine dehydrogenase
MIKVAMLGFGTVGSGFYQIFKNSQVRLEKKFGDKIEISGALVRNKDLMSAKYSEVMFTDNYDELLATNPHIVVEAIGGVDAAYDMAVKALSRKMHYITANKDLIAEKGPELRELANENGVRLLYEASVAGGIPIVKPIKECLSGEKISMLAGIINGTSNYILSRMYDEGSSFDDVLKDAQELGYAEANPTADVDGLDAGRKLAIMSTLAYGVDVDWKDLKIEGIRGVENADVEYAKSIGYKIKLIALSSNSDKGIYATVMPLFVSNDSYFGKTDGVFNGVMVEGEYVGTLHFMGRGAGALPTGNSVFMDLEDILETIAYGKSLDNDLKIGGKAEKIITEYPFESEWVLTFKSIEEELKSKSLSQFEDVGLEMRCEDGWDKVYIKTGKLTEGDLKSRIGKLGADAANKIKTYRVM